MKNTKYIYLLILLLSIFSCRKKYYTNNNYLAFKNNTNYEVVATFVSRADTIQFKEFLVPAHSTIYGDTSIVEYYCNDGCRPVNSTTDNYLYWINKNNHAIIYDFEGIKISDFQNIDYYACDTSSTISACNFNIKDTIIEETENMTFYNITTTYYITQQQYLLADSL